MRFEKTLLVGGKATMDERERRVAAEDHASLAPHAVVERQGEAFHPDDRSHAKRDAKEEDAQARQPAPQVAQGEAQDRRAARPCNESSRRRVHGDSLLPPGEGGGDSLLPPGEGGGRSPSDEGVASKPSARFTREPSPPTPLPLERG